MTGSPVLDLALAAFALGLAVGFFFGVAWLMRDVEQLTPDEVALLELTRGGKTR